MTNMKPANVEDRIIINIKQKMDEATRPFEKVAIKWVGWLAVYLMMTKGARVRFANSDEQVEQTMETLTNDLNELRRKEIRHSTNRVRTGNNNRRSK